MEQHSTIVEWSGVEWSGGRRERSETKKCGDGFHVVTEVIDVQVAGVEGAKRRAEPGRDDLYETPQCFLMSVWVRRI